MESGANEEETEHVLSSRSSNLLSRFCGGFPADELAEEAGGGDSDEIELGLSLGGCFSSVDSQKKRISRSSSIPAFLSCELQPVIPLSRAYSLPSEMEEEIWRRKEMQSMKRMEAKRKMDERRRGGEMFEQDLEGGSAAKSRRFDVPNGGSWIMRGGPANTSVSPGTSRWIAGAALPWTSPKAIPPASQGSVASQGSSSSQGSELESRSGGPGQGFEISGFIHSFEAPAMAERKNHKAPSFSPSSSAAPASKPANGSAIGSGTASKETLLRMNAGRCCNGDGMEEMPSVSTRVAGPDGRKIEGFLYRYRGGEEVRIVCVCHGSFLTPAEFVKHGGGGDVEHPLKHIVVNSSPTFL